MIDRPNYINELIKFKDKDLIKIITGIRRCGKSTLMNLFKEYLLQSGIDSSQIISINLEDLKYNFIQNYMDLYNYITENLLEDKKNYIFIDEIQIIPEFQKVADSLYLNKNIDLYITGSNAKLLSSELSTLLTGRYVEIKMLPLSFKEFISSKDITDLETLYNEYISLGSFPYTTQLEEDEISRYLGTLFNDVIIKDVMIRKGITDESMLKSVATFALDNIGNLLSSNNIANTITSDGRSINVRTVEKYLEGFIESFFLYKASRYDVKGKQYLKTGEKYYVSDLGLRYFMLGRKLGDRGHILENIVYLELLRRGYDVYIGKVDDYEVDFVALNSEGRIYIQVCETLRDNENKTLTRELNSLERIPDNYTKIILTMDKMPLSNENGIIVKNALDWLLNK
ncbi:MAG: ATP-binding protein [Clostridia bacterium]|nr:ATP-binding protein [Clostridia bacterium]